MRSTRRSNRTASGERCLALQLVDRGVVRGLLDEGLVRHTGVLRGTLDDLDRLDLPAQRDVRLGMLGVRLRDLALGLLGLGTAEFDAAHDLVVSVEGPGPALAEQLAAVECWSVHALILMHERMTMAPSCSTLNVRMCVLLRISSAGTRRSNPRRAIRRRTPRTHPRAW